MFPYMHIFIYVWWIFRISSYCETVFNFFSINYFFLKKIRNFFYYNVYTQQIAYMKKIQVNPLIFRWCFLQVNSKKPSVQKQMWATVCMSQYAAIILHSETIKRSCLEITSSMEDIVSLLTKRHNSELRSPYTVKLSKQQQQKIRNQPY